MTQGQPPPDPAYLSDVPQPTVASPNLDGEFLGEPEADVERPSQLRKSYDPGWAREVLRSAIALLSFVLFAVVILVLLFAVTYGGKKWDDVQGVAAVVLPTVTSVLSATTAFYFATKDGRNQ